jgi:hypothetical protein
MADSSMSMPGALPAAPAPRSAPEAAAAAEEEDGAAATDLDRLLGGDEDGEGCPPAAAAGAPRLADYTQAMLASQNALARLSIQIRTHKRYPADAIHDEAQALGATLRGALERLVDQTAPRLAVQRDQAARRAILVEQVKALGRTLRREMPRALRRLRLAGKKAV